jgi:two-component system, OmpR family, response regulator MprA
MSHSSGGRSRSGTQVRKTNPMVIIALEDDDQRKARATHLVDSGFTTLGAASAAEALAYVARYQPEAIVVDVDSRSIDGLAVARRLRSTPETRDIAIVGFASEVTPDRATLAASAGCEVLLLANCAPEVLLTELLILLAPPSGEASSDG